MTTTPPPSMVAYTENMKCNAPLRLFSSAIATPVPSGYAQSLASDCVAPSRTSLSDIENEKKIERDIFFDAVFNRLILPSHPCDKIGCKNAGIYKYKIEDIILPGSHLQGVQFRCSQCTPF